MLTITQSLSSTTKTALIIWTLMDTEPLEDSLKNSRISTFTMQTQFIFSHPVLAKILHTVS